MMWQRGAYYASSQPQICWVATTPSRPDMLMSIRMRSKTTFLRAATAVSGYALYSDRLIKVYAACCAAKRMVKYAP